jgi:hypothetical protein
MARLDQVREGQVTSSGEVDGGPRQHHHPPDDLQGLRDLPQEEGKRLARHFRFPAPVVSLGAVAGKRLPDRLVFHAFHGDMTGG